MAAKRNGKLLDEISYLNGEYMPALQHLLIVLPYSVCSLDTTLSNG